MKKFKRKNHCHKYEQCALLQNHGCGSDTEMEPISMVKQHQLLQFINPLMKAVKYQYTSKKEGVLSITTREERSILSHRRFLSPGYE